MNRKIQDLDNLIDILIEIFGEDLVNPRHHPKIFQYQLKLAKHVYLLRKEKDKNLPSLFEKNF